VRIGIIGSGNIGETAARLFVRAGHEVALSNSRGPQTLRAAAAALGPAARAATVDEAAAFGEVVLVAIPFGRYESLPVAPLKGKIVVDANNYFPRRDGEIDLGGRTTGEVLAGHLTGARVVKAFNTMYYETLAAGGAPQAPPDERLALFVAGDDAAAKAVVSRLIEEIGFAPVDTGSLHEGGRLQEMGSPLIGEPVTGAAARVALQSARRQ